MIDRSVPAARFTILAAVLAAPATAWATTRAAAPGGFFADGIRHILTGYDHVLFLLCLLLPAVMRRSREHGWQPVERLSEALWPIVGIVSAFTLAHSITLALAALGHVTLPASFVEPAIALTIVLAAFDNVVPIFPVRRVVVAFVFGLIHGFGFAGVLAELDLPGPGFALALLQFNLGLESGQLLIVAVTSALLFTLRARDGYRRVVIGGGSCAAMLLAAAWFVERSSGVALLPF
ncbi:HupE/UreJ family protein [Piscinibacter koreensis]|uniref:HupE/UreJ family protein n=1 Tax=Piscinibacter koreensis TaxID=2742824 RepID=A0A7Y6TYI9_9BURK|nr:HupE/UreJ family protein [Schlegelella koreensis]NUZ08298.1 HupE/UreJ family protein [Schlegelella koreensis]